MRVFGLAVLLVALFPSCKGSGSGGPATVAEFCSEYAAAICQVEDTCGASKATCETKQQGQCVAGASLADDGRRRYTAANAPDCIKKVTAAYGSSTPITPTTMAGINLACGYVYQGDVRLLGGYCSTQFDCAGPTDGTIVCDGRANRCAIAKTVGGGERCDSTGDVCATNFYCPPGDSSATVCTADGTTAAASGCSGMLPCDSDSHCVYDDNGVYQSPGVCMPLAGMGEVCSFDGDCSPAAPRCNTNEYRCDLGLLFEPGSASCNALTSPYEGEGGASGGEAGASGNGGAAGGHGGGPDGPSGIGGTSGHDGG
jgi:hypothetical protein